MKLIDIANELESLDDNYVITCSGKPNWSPDSSASLVLVEEFSEPSNDVFIPNYFLEVFIAKEVLDVWKNWRNERIPTADERCEALIYYAKNDAYIPLSIRP